LCEERLGGGPGRKRGACRECERERARGTAPENCSADMDLCLYLYKQEIETLQLPHGMKIYPPEFPMRDSLAALAGCVECLFVRSPCVLVVYFLRKPSRVPYGTPSACANRAADPAPPPVVPHPESIDAQAAYR
jgi:hypothetical protein